MTRAAWHMDHDWYTGLVPANVQLEPDVFIESAYCLTMFRSQREPGLVLGRASGVYDQTAFHVGPAGKVEIGEFTCLNSTTIVCNQRIEIGRHCLTAWGAVITDTWLDAQVTPAQRSAAMDAAATEPRRALPSAGRSQPVRLEDNVWVGFDAVILPGVTLGRGCVVGCKTVVRRDVEPYTVVVGNPPRVVKRLNVTDTDDVRAAAIGKYDRSGH
ncbi:MAG: acyltransferase [Phycisphaeraceae bacterium]|nr:acyltransferase [Phycisphaeraceae bacterium]